MIAVYPMGLTGIEINEIEYDIEDHVVWFDGDHHKSKIYYGGNPYFMAYGKRVHLNECLRTEVGK